MRLSEKFGASESSKTFSVEINIIEKQEPIDSKDLRKAEAWKFIILVGVVSLFSDMTYEGARSITGPFLWVLNASATVVGVVAGLGEFIGYALRLVSGYLTDRLGKYWSISFVGYTLNLFAVPLLALAGNWELAALLILMERIGKAIRTPARDAMLSTPPPRWAEGGALVFMRPWIRPALCWGHSSSPWFSILTVVIGLALLIY